MGKATNGITSALLLSLVACSGSEATSNPPVVASITLTGAPTASLVPGEAAQLQAAVIGTDGAPMSGQTISWSSSNTAIATVTASGLVTAVAAGQAVITASAGGRSATGSLMVVAGGNIGADGGTIVLYGGTATLAIPAQALTATTRIEISAPQVSDATVIAGTVFEIGPGTFTFSRAVVLTWQYDPTRLPAGVTEASLTLYSAVGASGNWDARTTTVDTVANTLTAFLGTSGRYAFVTKPVKFVQLVGVMPELAIGIGQKRYFEARTFDTTGVRLAGRALTWASSNSARATVNADGIITGVSPGDVTITASSEGVSAQVSLTVLGGPTANWSNVTEWTTFGGTVRRNGFVDVTVDLAAIRQLWSVPTGAIRDVFYSFNTYLPPVIGAGTVLLSNGGFIAAFDATSGAKKWQRQALRYAPGFGNGRFYVQNYDSLLALNPADGSVAAVAMVRSTEVAMDGTTMVIGDAVFTSQGGLRRFNATTLNETWSQTSVSPAASANGLLYVFGTSTSSSGVTAFDVSTGQVAFAIPGTTSALTGRNLVLGSLANAIGTCGVSNEIWGQCLASFDLTNRTQAWVLPQQFEGTPSVGLGAIYVVRRNFDPEFRTSLEARRESDGQLLWSWFPPAAQQFFSPPNVKGDVIVTRNVAIVGMGSGASSPFPNQATWIIDLATRKQLAALPPGRLAISSQGVLYIATGNTGDLTAVALK